VAGIPGLVLGLPLLWRSDALGSMTRSLGQPLWLVIAAYAAVLAGAGALYGRVFMRAANDGRGGWLFGISYGYLLWMLGPVTLVQWVMARPVLMGGASRGLLAAHLLYGLVLGLLFPRVHRLIQRHSERLE
jgi:hypothetical protein